MSLCIINETHAVARDEQFIAQFEQTVKDMIEKFVLIEPQDKVVVAVSGGKDSTVLLHVLNKLGYDVEAVTVDVHIGCYTKKNFENITNFCAKLGVKLHASSFRKSYGYSVCYMTSMLRQKNKTLGSCTVCGVLRRKSLNQLSREVGATKIATGHNMDDEAQTILMNVIKGKMNLNARLGPKQTLAEDNFVQRIKPLYFISEAEIEKYSKMHNFPVHYGRCPCGVSSTRGRLRDKLTDAQKNNIMKWFTAILPALRQKYKSSKTLNKCNSCSEPCTGSLCQACKILNQIQAG